MKSIVFFNNKGGVGKTTLCCNIASYLSTTHKKKVLLIDADPQCNATQSILPDDIVQDLYFSKTPKFQTLLDIFDPFLVGESTISKTIVPVKATENNFEIDLIPGHPKLSLIEDVLSQAWADLSRAGIGGFRQTNWLSQVLTLYGSQYDYIFLDVGPSLGALNRTILLGSDNIVSPLGCDIFSILGIKNISEWILRWQKLYQQRKANAESENSSIFSKYAGEIVLDTNKKFRIVGYSIQQYVTRKFKAGKRPVKAYEEIMQEIPQTVNAYMKDFISPNINTDDLELGHIPYVYSLIPRAQSNNCPIHKLKGTEGVVGSMNRQIDEYDDLLKELTLKLLTNLGK